MAYYGQRTFLYKTPYSDWEEEDEYVNVYEQSSPFGYNEIDNEVTVPYMNPYTTFDNNLPSHLPEATNPLELREGDTRIERGREYEYMITDEGEGVWALKLEEVEIVVDRCLHLFVSEAMQLLKNTIDYSPSPDTYSRRAAYTLLIAYNRTNNYGLFDQIVDAYRRYLDCSPPYVPPVAHPSKYEKLHNTLDWLGMIPFVGEIFDVVNALIYAAEGDLVNAGISAAAILPIPVIGSAGTGARQANKIVSGLIEETEQRVFRDIGNDMAEPILMRGGGGAAKGGAYVVQQMEGFYVRSSTVFSKGVYTRNVQTLASLNEGTSVAKLLNAFEAEARAMGANKVIINGVDIVNPKLFNAQMAQRFGYSFEQTSSNSIQLIKKIK